MLINFIGSPREPRRLRLAGLYFWLLTRATWASFRCAYFIEDFANANNIAGSALDNGRSGPTKFEKRQRLAWLDCPLFRLVAPCPLDHSKSRLKSERDDAGMEL